MSDRVIALMREAAKRYILPRFRNPKTQQVREKTPGDLVTIADEEAEKFLYRELTRIWDVPFVGEESWDKNCRAGLHQGSCWIVDPIDGTRSFVEGDDCFAMIVARVHHHRCEEGWLFFPARDELFHAVRGQGTTFNKDTAHVNNTPRPGRYRLSWVEPKQRKQLETKLIAAGWTTDTPTCWELRRFLRGEEGGYLCSHVTPWDMTAGVLLACEAGGYVLRSDGKRPHPTDEAGLYIFAPDEVAAYQWLSTFKLSELSLRSPLEDLGHPTTSTEPISL